MLDFSWLELLIVMIVAVFVIGPKEVPALMYGFGRLVRRLQYVKFAFSQQFDEFMRANDLEDIQRSVNFEAPVYDEEASDKEDVMGATGDNAVAIEGVPEKEEKPSS